MKSLLIANAIGIPLAILTVESGVANLVAPFLIGWVVLDIVHQMRKGKV